MLQVLHVILFADKERFYGNYFLTQHMIGLTNIRTILTHIKLWCSVLKLFNRLPALKTACYCAKSMDTAIFKLLGNLAGRNVCKKYNKEYQNTERHTP